jgi:hypothetical protein
MIFAIAILILFVGGVLALGFIRLLVAKPLAIRDHRKSVDLFWGLLQLVLWEQNEGLVFLKNKTASEVIYGPEHGGGTRYIYPMLGDELRVRVPLTLRLTSFEDENILTRESIRIYMKVATWWRISDLQKIGRVAPGFESCGSVPEAQMIRVDCDSPMPAGKCTRQRRVYEKRRSAVPVFRH